MKKNQTVALALATLAVVYSCKDAVAESHSNQESPVLEEASGVSTEAKSATSSSAAVETKNSSRKVIRKADIKFRVQDVTKSTYAIENATAKFGGFVTYTNLQSTISEREETKISQDSTLERTKYIVENDITIRVPNTRLDTVIKTIAKQINYLDYRIIKADDISVQILSNQLAQNRSSNSEKRITKAIDNKGRKLNDILDAEDQLDSKKEQNDNSKLDNISLKDQVNFSTITLNLYQRESIKQEMVANPKSNNAYRPNIGIQIWDSIKTGWFMLEAVIAFVVQMWGIGLIGIAGFFIYKKYLKK